MLVTESQQEELDRLGQKLTDKYLEIKEAQTALESAVAIVAKLNNVDPKTITVSWNGVGVDLIELDQAQVPC